MNHAVEKAAEAFLAYSKKSTKQKAEFLDAIGDEIMALGDELIDRCMKESGLPDRYTS